MSIKPIETIYNGYRFGSRLEARWAVFFDTLGIKYEYEKEGYDIDGTYYLPDFWLPELDCWFEVKGQEPTQQECKKASALALYSEKHVYLAVGEISESSKMFHFYVHAYLVGSSVWLADGYYFDTEMRGKSFDIAFSSRQHLPPELWCFLTDLRERGIYFVLSQDRVILVGGGERLKSGDQSFIDRYQDALVHAIKESNAIKKRGYVDTSCLWFVNEHSVERAWEIFVSCTNCGVIRVKNNDKIHACENEKYTRDNPRPISAFEAARQARFEHGEKGR